MIRLTRCISLNSRISLLISTRDRGELLKRTIETAIITAANKDELEFILYIDGDDKPTIDLYYKSLIASNVKAIFGLRQEIIGQGYNECCKISRADICMLCTDDVIFHTKNWDDLVVNEFSKYPDGIVLIYGEDDIQHGRTATLPFLHRNWINTIGHFLPAHFINEFCDRWLTDVAKMIGRCVYLENLHIQHLHHTQNTMSLDRTYLDRRKMSRNKMPLNSWRKLYHSLANERKIEADKLQNFIDNFED